MTMLQNNVKLNILIVSASIGSGHQQAALALQTSLRTQAPDATIHTVDFMSSEHSMLNAMMKHTYLSMLQSIPDMYDLIYRWSQEGKNGSKVRRLLTLVMKKTMQELVEQYRPDLLLFTHPFPCGAAVALKHDSRLRPLLAAIITDFTVHRLWVYSQVDSYFVPARAMRRTLLAEGIEPSRVHVTGIPISERFAAPRRYEDLLQASDASDDKPIVLIMGGGLGLGNLHQTIRVLSTLPLSIHIVAVAGRNEELSRSLNDMSPFLQQKLTVLGYTDQIPELMSSSSLLITKPGGLTCAEALAANLPLLLYRPLPGPECDNARFLTNNNAAVSCETVEQLRSQALRLLVDAPARSRFQQNATRIARPNAAIDISKILLSDLKGRCTNETHRTFAVDHRDASAANN